MTSMIDDFEFDSDSDDGVGADGRDRKVNDLKGMIARGATSDFAWTTEHVLICHLISLYGKCATRAGDEETWIRSMALSVLMYECISAGVLDFDYAPVLTNISHNGASRKVWLNLSQEAQTAIDELRMHGMIRMVRMYTIDYKPMSAYQVSQQGLRMMKAVPGALFDELKAVVYVPDHENSFTDRVQISWDDDKSLFALRSVKSGYLRYSTITEIEDVSYVSSPYIPAFLRRGQAETTNNRARAHHAFAGMTNIKDGDLMEVAPKKLAKDAARMENNSHQIWTAVVLGEVRLLLAEWVPFGENSISSMSINLGAMDRCKQGMFTAMVDKQPSATLLRVPAGLTHVRVLDCDLLHHVNVEAEINYPEDDGIIQIEFFGIHVSTRGNVLFGLAVDSIMTRDHDAISLDLLTRMAVDVVQDSSTILHDLMSEHQRELIDKLHQGHADKRPKFAIYLAAHIDPFFATSTQYLDRGEHENEMAQIIGQIRFAKDLSNSHFFFMGTIGVLLVGARAHLYDAFLVPYANLQALMLAADTIFARFNHIFEMLDAAMELVHVPDGAPHNVELVQDLMSRAAQEINLLGVVISHMRAAGERALMPPEPHDEVGIALFAALRCRQWQASVIARAKSLEQLIVDAERKVNHLKPFATVVNKHGLLKRVVETGDNVRHMGLNVVNKYRLGLQYWRVQSLLAAVFVVKLLDGYRWGVKYCSIRPLDREVKRVVSRVDIEYTYTAPEVWSEACPWIGIAQGLLGAYPFVFLAVAAAFFLVSTLFWDKCSYLLWKRARKQLPGHLNHWLNRFGDEDSFGRVTHRVELDKLQVFISEAALRAYVESKRQIRECPRHEVLHHIDAVETHCLLHWRETGNRKAWAGIGAPDVTLCWDREVGVLRSVKLDVHRRIKGLHVSDLWPVLRSRLADAGVIEDPATRAETLGVDVKNRVLQRGRDVDETKKLSAESKVLGDDDGEHVGVSHAQQAAAEEQAAKVLTDAQRKGLSKKIVAQWRVEHRAWKKEMRRGRRRRQQASKEARQRVLDRLYQDAPPPLWRRALRALWPWPDVHLEDESSDEEPFESEARGGNADGEADGRTEHHADSEAGSEPAGGVGDEPASDVGGNEEGDAEGWTDTAGADSEGD